MQVTCSMSSFWNFLYLEPRFHVHFHSIFHKELPEFWSFRSWKFQERILLTLVSHLEWNIIPGLLFAKSGGHAPNDTALEISKRYFWSALRSFLSISGRATGTKVKLVRESVSQAYKDFPIIPEKCCGPDVFPSIFWKRRRRGSSSVCNRHTNQCNLWPTKVSSRLSMPYFSNVDIRFVIPNGN